MHKISESTFVSLMHRLAIVNAALQDDYPEDREHNLAKRREIIDLIAQERFGSLRQAIWKTGERPTV